MARLIDLDKLMNEIYNHPLFGIARIIERVGTVDAVEVVHCKDCKYFRLEGECCLHDEFTGFDDFCSCAEKTQKGD